MSFGSLSLSNDLAKVEKLIKHVQKDTSAQQDDGTMKMSHPKLLAPGDSGALKYI